MKERFQNIAVVLVRPAGDLNIGAAARAMKNTGFNELILADPAARLTEGAYRMAVSSGEILDRARTVPSLGAALADRHVSFGVTARHRHKKPRLLPAEAAEIIKKVLEEGHKVALVFGPEDRGLSSEEIDLCQHLVGIPAHPDLGSFNLAQAVLLLCHALYTALSSRLEEGSAPCLATGEDRERLEQGAVDLLRAVSYLTPNREAALLDLVKRLAFRSPLETRDVRHLLAIIRHLRIKGGEE